MTAPCPPSNIGTRRLPTITVPAGNTLHRYYTKAFTPIYFDRSRAGRFNDPFDRFGVLYTAHQARGAFAETFLRQPGKQTIPEDLLRRKGHVLLVVARDLHLVALMGTGLAKLGATAEVTHGGLPYDVPQAWSSALHTHAAMVDGIAYRARHDDQQVCYAIFDRAKSAITERRRVTDLDTDVFWALAEVYGVSRALP